MTVDGAWGDLRDGPDEGLPCARRSSSSIRHMPFTNESRSRAPQHELSHSLLEMPQRIEFRRKRFKTHQMLRNISLSNLDAFQTSLIIEPGRVSSGPMLQSTSSLAASPLGLSPGFVIKSTERPLQPAAFRVFFDGCLAASSFLQ